MFDRLIDLLEKSVEKNGDIPLTNKHLMNILKMVDRQLSEEAAHEAQFGHDPRFD